MITIYQFIILFTGLTLLAGFTTGAADPGSTFVQIVQAARGGQWILFLATVLMITTEIVNRVLHYRIPKSILPWLVITLSIITQVLFTLAAGKSLLEAVGAGITIGFAACGGWSAFGKHMMRKKRKE